MKGFKPRRPSPALIVSIIAVILALGGTSYAALNLPSNSVGTKQLRNRAVTGAKIRNGAVTGSKLNLVGFTVPNAQHASSADTASSATNATNANHASSADNATNATNSSHATSATSANHATSADSATNATNATNASDAAALGGIAAAGYTRNGCDVTTGQIKGFAYVDPSTLTTSFANISVGYNCSGLAVQAKRTAAGEYEVRFLSNPALIAVGSANDSCAGIPCPETVSVLNVSGGDWKVRTTNPGGTDVDAVFNMIVP